MVKVNNVVWFMFSSVLVIVVGFFFFCFAVLKTFSCLERLF